MTTASYIFDTIVTFPEVGCDEPHPGRQLEGNAEAVLHRQNLCTVRDSLIACHFALFNNALKPTHFLNWYNFITWRGLSFDDFMTLGARIFNLKRMINNRYGITRKDDTLPPRMRTLRKVGKDIDFDVPPINPMLSEYYALRGWTEEGRPNAETIAEYGLEEFAAPRVVTVPFVVHEGGVPEAPAPLPEDQNLTATYSTGRR